MNQLLSLGLVITLAAAAAADPLKPLVDRMAEMVQQSRVIQTDDTPVPVLDPGFRRTRTGHLWVYLGDADHPYAVFDFTPTYSGERPRAWLGNYAGYVQADALKQYDPLFDRPPPRPTEVGCWAHARRKFHESRTTDPARAHEAIARIRRLYDIEAEVRPLDAPGRLAARQTHARPVLDGLFSWLEQERSLVFPKSPMGTAIGYALGNRAALSRYAEAGFLADGSESTRSRTRGAPSPGCPARRTTGWGTSSPARGRGRTVPARDPCRPDHWAAFSQESVVCSGRGSRMVG